MYLLNNVYIEEVLNLSDNQRTSSIYIRKDEGRWSEAVGTVSKGTLSVVI